MMLFRFVRQHSCMNVQITACVLPSAPTAKDTAGWAVVLKIPLILVKHPALDNWTYQEDFWTLVDLHACNFPGKKWFGAKENLSRHPFQ